ncbi:TPA: transposase, partial [Escherichia coli]|nr:IS200/IS605 family transposase [Escherichia coli]EGQ6061279.1 IS200/IS605 family transposase [Escherichia coli]
MRLRSASFHAPVDHLVFVTKYRRQIFDHDATEKLRTYFSKVCADFEAEL